MEDFAADFVQTTRSALFGGASPELAEPARGTVVFAKPGRMRWTYTEPEPSLVISDGTTLWLVAPDLGEAQRMSMTEGYLTGAALQFLLGDGKLLDAFAVSSRDCDLGAPTVVLDLTPRVAASYDRLSLTAATSDGAILSSTVVDLFGNETRIEFDNVRRDQRPGSAIFEFLPSPEIEVIDLRESP